MTRENEYIVFLAGLVVMGNLIPRLGKGHFGVMSHVKKAAIKSTPEKKRHASKSVS